MSLNANSLTTNILVTVLVAVFVVFLPWMDRKVCGRLGISLRGGVNAHPRADHLLKIRQWILMTGVFLYLLLFAWLVFFSRTAMNDYAVHVAPLEDLKNAFQTDHGFSDVFSRIFTEGIAAAFANVKLVRPEDIAQFYMNLMVFVPLGYLLPYTFRWFRERVRTRPVGVCFLISFATENIQLMSQRGLYDLDDMISNTLGGLIGQTLYILLAYVLTHPDWKRQAKADARWRKSARKLVLASVRRRIGVNRTVLLGTDPERIREFYAGMLGYRVDRDAENRMLLVLGKSRIEFRTGETGPLPAQTLYISVAGLAGLRQKLVAHGANPGGYKTDPLTGQRELRLTGPDKVEIVLLEEE